MSESETRKIIQRNIFDTMWRKANRWCQENPIEKLDIFKQIRFHIGISEVHQTYIGFEMNADEDWKIEFDGDSRQIVGQWGLTWDKNMNAPVMLHFHSLDRSNFYYLSSDCKTFLLSRSSKRYNQRLYDPKIIKLLKTIFDIDYNKFRNTFSYND